MCLVNCRKSSESYTGPGQFLGGSIRPPLVTNSRTSWLLLLGYGMYPREKISHSSTPKDLHTGREVWVWACTHTHIQIHSQMLIHTHMHTCKHPDTHTETYTHTQRHKRAHSHGHTHTHAHMENFNCLISFFHNKIFNMEK